MRLHKKILVPMLALLVLTLGACEQRSYDDLLAKVKGLSTPEEVKTAIGPADKIAKVGTMELWKYKTSETDVCFAAAGNTIVRLSCI